MINRSGPQPSAVPYEAQYFQSYEYECPCCGLNNMQPDFLRQLDLLRVLCGFPLVLSSGCRCPMHNKLVGGGVYSAHLEGVAVDILCSHDKAWQILNQALLVGFAGIGVQQHGPKESRILHIDQARHIDNKRPRPTVWSY